LRDDGDQRFTSATLALNNPGNYLVAVIGAGPAGLFAARQLASFGVSVVLINRDIAPGGLAEYGIFFDKVKMKEGLRKQFRQILDSPHIEYYGNVTVGQKNDLSLAEIRALGFQAVMVTVGAQGTKWLGLPGENMTGVFHSKEIVYHYNLLPPFSTQTFTIGNRVAVVGVGNVMLDIAHWLIRELKVGEVIAVARRGPAEVKFTKPEMAFVACNLDLAALDAEFVRVAPMMRAVGQDVDLAKAFILSALSKGLEPVSTTRFRFEFLASPSRMVGDERGVVHGLEVEDTTLVAGDGEPQAKRLGTKRILPVDTVIFCIGDKVDDNFGLPVRRNEFVKNPQPRFPIDGISYEAFDPDMNRAIDRMFVAGWSREASHGLVGVARRDGENGADAVWQYLQTLPTLNNVAGIKDEFHQHLNQLGKPIVTKEDWQRIDQAEQAESVRRGMEGFKFGTNEAMLAAIGKVLCVSR